jgi:hypothetical protein
MTNLCQEEFNAKILNERHPNRVRPKSRETGS